MGRFQLELIYLYFYLLDGTTEENKGKLILTYLPCLWLMTDSSLHEAEYLMLTFKSVLSAWLLLCDLIWISSSSSSSLVAFRHWAIYQFSIMVCVFAILLNVFNSISLILAISPIYCSHSFLGLPHLFLPSGQV